MGEEESGKVVSQKYGTVNLLAPLGPHVFWIADNLDQRNDSTVGI